MPLYFDWSKKINIEELNKVSDTIQNDGIIVFPTETVYGIGVNALSEKAIRKLYELKERETTKPISIIVSEKKEIEKYAIINNKIEQKIIDKYMPGPVTLVLEKKDVIPSIVTAGKNTIGIRIPDNKISIEILKKCKVPIAASSANISGMESGTDIKYIKNNLKNNVDIYIDSGKSEIGVPSTIIQVIDEEIIVLRNDKNIEINI
ncbi:MAG TPA: L-threonylcarbamoyladenylate synthase [Clostridia bacterium]|nr:L-threonylcarbamoyladenylate synthase [Clostridia bacterium]